MGAAHQFSQHHCGTADSGAERDHNDILHALGCPRVLFAKQGHPSIIFDAKTKTELLIFLTPHVAAEPDLLKPMGEDEMHGLRLVPSSVEPGVFQEHMNGMERGGFPQTQPVQPTSPVDSIEENNPTTQP